MADEEKRKKIKCLIRNAFVAKTPEELIRQKVIHYLINTKNFPKSGIVLEKNIKTMPHLLGYRGKIPNRRADIICFAKGIDPHHEFYPLLMIECKAVKLTAKVKAQVFGYNHYVKAYFVAIANETELEFGFYDEKESSFHFISQIPSFEELVSSIKSRY